MGVIWTGKHYTAALKAVGAEMDCPSCREFSDWRFLGIAVKRMDQSVIEGDGLLVTAAYCSECGFVREHFVPRLEEDYTPH